MNYLKKQPFNPAQYDEDRAKCIDHRSGAISVAFDELDGLINKTVFTRDYMGKSQGWFSQRLHNAHVCCSDVEFKPAEARLIAESFRDIARRLTGLASEIEAVADID